MTSLKIKILWGYPRYNYRNHRSYQKIYAKMLIFLKVLKFVFYRELLVTQSYRLSVDTDCELCQYEIYALILKTIKKNSFKLGRLR